MNQLTSLRQIRDRIKSIENTEKITHAMEVISMSKMQSTNRAYSSALPYFKGLESIIKNVLSNAPESKHPFLENRQKVQKIALVLFTSDTGLCGIYNHAIINNAEDFINKHKKDNVILITVGKKGFSYFKRKGFTIPHVYTDLHGRYNKEIADDLLKTLTDIYLSRQVDNVYAAYTHSQSASRNVPIIEKFLNIEFEKTTAQAEYIFESDIDSVLAKLIPEYIQNKLKIIMIDSFLAEHSARLLAMSQATDNAKELCDSLVLLRNKVRQTNITTELLDIISSTETLK